MNTSIANEYETTFLHKFYTTKEKVEEWLIGYKVTNYTINEDLTVDVNGNVNLSQMSLYYLPLMFGVINGNFNCSSNELTSLLGCPKQVKGDFNCMKNKLTTLEHSPILVYGYYGCCYNKLTNLEGIASYVGGDFDCGNNQLKTLKYSPLEVGGNFYCMVNPIENLNNFECVFGKSFNHALRFNNEVPQYKILIEDLESFYIDDSVVISYDQLNKLFLKNKLEENIEHKNVINKKVKI